MIGGFIAVMGWLLARGTLVLFLGLFVAQLAALEAGFRLGSWRRSAEGPDHDGIGVITAGMLGLLGFTLGLTISIAQSRFEARRETVVLEANTIGTAWLRAGLMGEEQAAALRHEIAEYTKLRIDFVQAEAPEQIAGDQAATSAAQNRIWAQAQSWARANPSPISASLIASLNDMIDASLSQRFAFESGLPPIIALMLLAGSVLALGAVGYQLGVDGRRRVMLTSLLLLMWSGGIAVTGDLSAPRAGSVRATAKPLIWTLQGFTSPQPAQSAQSSLP